MTLGYIANESLNRRSQHWHTHTHTHTYSHTYRHRQTRPLQALSLLQWFSSLSTVRSAVVCLTRTQFGRRAFSVCAIRHLERFIYLL